MCGNDFDDIIHARFSVRKYSDRPVEESKLKMVLEAGRIAPTAKNVQPFRIYVLKSKEAMDKIRSITPMAFDAPLMIMVGAELDKTWKSPFGGRDHSCTDTAIVTDHMMLQAQALGLGTCWVGWFDPALVHEAFGLPDNIEITDLLPIGYPADDCVPGPMHSKRKSMDELVEYL